MAIELPTSPDFVSAIDRVLELGDEGRAALTYWLQDLPDERVTGPVEIQDVKSLADATGLERRSVVLTASAVHFLLGVTYREQLDSTAIAGALVDAGTKKESAALVADMIARLPGMAEKVGRAQRTAQYCRSGAKQVQSAAFVCDLRAVWNTDVETSLDEHSEDGETSFVGWAPVVMMSLDLSQSPFTSEAVSAQFSREQFEEFCDLVLSTKKRLEIAVMKVEGELV